jgi:hypothetical protein
LHQDGKLDVFVAGYQGGNQVWLNDGQGQLSLSGPAIGDENGTDASLGDLDGDGDLDALVANGLGQPNRVWLNRFSGGSAPDRLAAPGGLAASTAGPGGIALVWTDNAVGESAYRVERSVDGNTGWAEIAHLPANSTSYIDAGVACGQRVYYRVRTWEWVDGVASPYSHLAPGQSVPCAAPLAPDNLQATAVSSSQIDLSWTDQASDESGYSLERSPAGAGNWAEIAWLPENTIAYANSGLACECGYAYRLRAYRASDGQFSTYSNLSEATTGNCPVKVYFPEVRRP